MSEPSDREKAAIRALYSGCMVREDMEALRGYVARVDRELNELSAKTEARFDCRGGPGWTNPACGGCVTCLTRELGEWEQAGQFVVDLFDPLKPKVSSTVLRVVAQGAKHANKTLRQRLADRGHTEACLTTYLDTFDPKCPTCNPKPERGPRCMLCGGNRDTCGHFVGHGAL